MSDAKFEALMERVTKLADAIDGNFQHSEYIARIEELESEVQSLRWAIEQFRGRLQTWKDHADYLRAALETFDPRTLAKRNIRIPASPKRLEI